MVLNPVTWKYMSVCVCVYGVESCYVEVHECVCVWC